MRVQQIWTTIINIFFICLLSCQSVPQTSSPLVSAGGAVLLEPGATVYLFADVPQARTILELIPVAGLKEKRVQQIIDTTKSAAVGIYPNEDGRQLQASAWGNYPSGAGGMVLGMSKAWKKQRAAGGYSYWYSQANRLSVAMSANQIYVAVSRTSAPVEPLGAGVTSPDGFSEFRKGSFLAGWIANPASLIAALKLPLELNINQIFIAFSPFVSDEKTDYLCEASLRMETAGPNEARSLMGMIALARMFAPSVSSPASGDNPGSGALLPLLLANAPVLDGKAITIKTAPLSGKDIALLFKFFSL